MVKLILTSDVHGSKKAIENAINLFKKNNADYLLLAGDITFLNRETDYLKILKPIFEAKVPLIILPGNHDDSYFLKSVLQRLSKKYNHSQYYLLEKNYFETKDFIFLGFSANNVGPTREIYSEKESKKILRNLFKKIEDKLKEKKLITVSHVHPFGYLEEKYEIPGSYAWYSFIKKYKPLIHFHGHLHEAMGEKYKIEKTKVFCLGIKPFVFELKPLLNQKNDEEKK
jgi:Icc-related predicted phosphoesterase